MKALILTLLLVIVVTLVIYDIRFNYDGYDILLRNRLTKLGFGIDYREGFEIWHFAHTVHGGIAEKPLYPDIATILKNRKRIELPNEIINYPYHWFKVNKEESKRMISTDLTGDGTDEIIIVQEYCGEERMESENTPGYYFDTYTFIFIYNQNEELMYKRKCGNPYYIMKRLRVVDKKIYGIEYYPLYYVGFKNGKFDCYEDKYVNVKLVEDELIGVTPTGILYAEDTDPIKCARLFVMGYYDIKVGEIKDENLPTDVQLMGSEAMIIVDYNSNRHIVRLEAPFLEAPFELPPEGVWTVVRMEIVAGEN